MKGGGTNRRHLIRTPKYKLQLVNRHIDSLQQRRDTVLVVLGAVFDQLNGGFEVVQEAVDIGQEDLDVAACLKKLGNFHDLHMLLELGF